MRWILLSTWLGLSLFSLVSRASAQEDSYGLQGLKTVGIVVSELSPDLERGGLHAAELRAKAEEMLKSIGIEPLPVESLFDPTTQAYIRLSVRSTLAAEKNRVYAVDLELRQKARLLREPDIEAVVTTWSSGEIGLTPVADMKEIEGAVSDLFSRFSVAYWKENPKPR